MKLLKDDPHTTLATGGETPAAVQEALEQEGYHGFLYEELVVLADHALAVLAACAATRAFVLEQHLIGRVVLAGKAQMCIRDSY